MTNSAGAVQETYTYNSYGQLSTAPTIVNPFTFTGREYDPESGNYYYRRRYYDPTLGRFMQRDPIGYYDSMNLFAYVFNDPINWIDPWGLARIIPRPFKPFGITFFGRPFGYHAYIRFDDGTTATLNRKGGKTWVGKEAFPLSEEEEKKFGRDAGVCDAALKDAVNKARDRDNPNLDEADWGPYDSVPDTVGGPNGTNNSNDRINQRLIEAGGDWMLRWDGRWLK